MNHLAGNPQASMPDTVPQKSDQSSDSLKSRMMAAAISILVLLGILLYFVLT
ncbi:hypothetical protein [Corynebacterium sp. A21]|uniref:hypothetical protein n=1 Tax=Corynebacterium sp. A21 TaxID=3457318 RepID=UPI003FD3AB4A